MNPEKATRWITERLHDHYGEVSVTTSDPLEELILTILSQNTNDTNRDRAYASLLSHFKDLDRVRQAPADKIAEAIQVGGLHRQKSSRIKLVLERIIQERGSLNLSFLSDLPLDRAMEWLLSSPGVGKKTAGIVMLFSFDKPYFPVDTHIRRVTTRLGLVGEKDDPHQQMNALLPPDPALMRRLHLQLIRLGRARSRDLSSASSRVPHVPVERSLRVADRDFMSERLPFPSSPRKIMNR
jgi:endonuclease-3